MTYYGSLFVIAAPSGAGKTTLVKAVSESLNDVMVSISHTTRAARVEETHGVNYYFINRVEFEKMIQAGDFLEHATVFDNFYGTSKSWVIQQLAQGKDVILEIDWQGHQQIKKLLPEAISIFILPPTLTALSARLITRQQDGSETIEKRVSDAKETVSHLEEFNYVVLNDDFNQAKQDLMTIIRANRLTLARQIKQLSRIIKEMV